MTNLSRRGFMFGSSAMIAAAAMPAVLPAAMPAVEAGTTIYASPYASISIDDIRRAVEALKAASITPKGGYYMIAHPGSREAALFKIMPGERRRECGILLIGGENGCG